MSWYVLLSDGKSIRKPNGGYTLLCNPMMMSSNGNIFCVTGPLCGEFTGPGEFPTQRPVTRSFDVFFDLGLNKRLNKHSWGWWFEMLSWSLWRHHNALKSYFNSLMLGQNGSCRRFKFVFFKKCLHFRRCPNDTRQHGFRQWFVAKQMIRFINVYINRIGNSMEISFCCNPNFNTMIAERFFAPDTMAKLFLIKMG